MPRVKYTCDEERGRGQRDYHKQYYENNKERLQESNRKRYVPVTEDKRKKKKVEPTEKKLDL